MTVKELIELLSNEDPEASVHFVYPSNDHWRTMLAPEVKRVDGEAYVDHSKYHNQDALLDDDEDEERYKQARSVVALLATRRYT